MNALSPSTAPEVRLPFAEALALAAASEQAGRIDEAAILLDAVLAAHPEHPAALHLAGILALHRGAPEQGATLIEQAVARAGQVPPLYLRNLCAVYERLGRYPESLAAGQSAATLAPYDADAWHNLSVAQYRCGDLEGAAWCARRALALDPALPRAHFALAEALLAAGQYAEGWDEYEWRFRIPEANSPVPPTDLPQWQGEALSGRRLLLVADQGFGDVIQFARYIPWARALCPDLLLACGPELAPLLRHSFSWLEVTQTWPAAAAFAAWCPLSGLPRLHGTRLDTIPAAAYLRADPAQVAGSETRLSRLLPKGYPRVGIAWAGRPTPPHRSASLRDFAPLGDLDHVALVSLQKPPAAAELGHYFGRAPLLYLGPELTDFAATAAVISNLDVIVTVDTATAHLAGALGRPAWILLPAAADWRWLRGCDRVPWYPQARLFRQSIPGRWAEPVESVGAELFRQFGEQCSAVGE